jgi:hypothetical protein
VFCLREGLFIRFASVSYRMEFGDRGSAVEVSIAFPWRTTTVRLFEAPRDAGFGQVRAPVCGMGALTRAETERTSLAVPMAADGMRAYGRRRECGTIRPPPRSLARDQEEREDGLGRVALTLLDVLNFVDLRLASLDPDFRKDRHQSLTERLQLLL